VKLGCCPAQTLFAEVVTILHNNVAMTTDSFLSQADGRIPKSLPVTKVCRMALN